MNFDWMGAARQQFQNPFANRFGAQQPAVQTQPLAGLQNRFDQQPQPARSYGEVTGIQDPLRSHWATDGNNGVYRTGLAEGRISEQDQRFETPTYQPPEPAAPKILNPEKSGGMSQEPQLAGFSREYLQNPTSPLPTAPAPPAAQYNPFANRFGFAPPQLSARNFRLMG